MTLNRRRPLVGMDAAPVPDRPISLGVAGQRLRLVWRAAAFVAVTVPAAGLQAVLIALPGRAKQSFARQYWATVCRIMGISRVVVGVPAGHVGRPLLYVCNHTSWLDIITLGGTLRGCFVSKAEVGEWPVVSLIARLGRTVFVSRRARETGRERDDMRARLAAGDDLILFPEGTSSDGARTLPFRSAFFSAAEARDGVVTPLIQPVSIVYDRVDGLPVGRAARPITSWYGDMDLGGHFVRLARYRRLRATIVLHGPMDPADYASRKDLARAVFDVVAGGAAALRQNRPTAPTATSDSLDSATVNNFRVEPA